MSTPIFDFFASLLLILGLLASLMAVFIAFALFGDAVRVTWLAWRKRRECEDDLRELAELEAKDSGLPIPTPSPSGLPCASISTRE